MSMKTCLVSLVGEQTIPNVLMICDLKPDYLLFITTPLMERKEKTKAILQTVFSRGLDYSGAYRALEIAEDSVIALESTVMRWLDETTENYQFTVNLTGGTKIMSIGAYDLFKDFGSTMVYIPIPKNEYLIPFPKRRPKEPVPLQTRLSVAEYLSAYGFSVTNRRQLPEQAKRARSRKERTALLFQHYNELMPMLRWIREGVLPQEKSARRKGCDFADRFQVGSDIQHCFLNQLGFRQEGNVFRKWIDKHEWEYLRGGWLEEFLYLTLYDILPDHADILLNVRCEDPQRTGNEFDVIFTLENALYLVECKSLGAAEGNEQGTGATINAFLYKLGALQRNFGLTPTSFLATTSPDVIGADGLVKPRLVERGNQFRTKIIPLLQITDLPQYLRDLLILS